MATLREPVKGFKVSNGWGTKDEAYDKIGYLGHNGVDYPCPAGTPVYAAADGVIAFEGYGINHSWMGAASGICVLIKHDDCYTDYCHLSRSILNDGVAVKAGQLIGYSGATGYAFGAHLHFSKLPLQPNWNNGYGGRIKPTFGKPKAKPKKRLYAIPKGHPKRGEFWVKVNPGNTLSGLAEWQGTTLAKVLKLNPQIDDKDVISVGEIIRLK